MHAARLDEAHRAIAKKLPKRGNDYRLGYHLSPPVGWMNDPNGLVFFQDHYHVFYQHHPYSAQWGLMYWGHARSRDLVHWEHLPIALAPGDAYDRDGCFSGSAVVVDDRLCLIYTGHRWLGEAGDDRLIRQVQCLASSTDGLNFTKQGPVIDTTPHPDIMHFRDPKVWMCEDHWRMALGARQGDDPQLLLYRSEDLHQWQYLGCALQGRREPDGYMWECPDVFELEGRDVFLYSPQGLLPSGYANWNKFQNSYRLGHLDSRGVFTDSGPLHELDQGHDFYAAQTLLAPDGRRLLWAWMDMWDSPMPSQAHHWCGALSLPRELSRDGDRLRMRPARELTALRQSRHVQQVGAIDSRTQTLEVGGALLELELELELGASSAERFGLALRCSDDGQERTLLYFDAMARRLVLDRQYSGAGVSGVRSVPVALEQRRIALRIYLDRSSIEVFVDDGAYSLSSRIYPRPDSLGIEAFAVNGTGAFGDILAWKLADLGL
ncbi:MULTISPECIES: glycoside hydrolase family 32 protein [Pseudomonas]|uniref:glycoside hydrolase family 32 protein n=1 Tax=Pseudomonas TaxID=286 RepID=UPI002361B9A9|nr:MULTISPECIES: sucrose-6-phosphate hydrolase [Pseudomonas]WJV24469.1 sucrose-6-phosphate hydrolase [Pseudomonas chlororaphis]